MTAADFIRSICADPDDDTPRLAYADWLEEQGQGERAEFIRVQCELAKCRDCHGTGRKPNPARNDTKRHNAGQFKMILADTVACCTDDGSKALRRRERELLGTDFCRWGVRIEGFTSHYRRGFVHAVTCTAAAWLAHADALAWHPDQKCGRCKGYGKGVFGKGGAGSQVCPSCRGTGRRPCPGTAQPVRSVTWTTIADDDVIVRHGAAVLARPGQSSLWTFTSWPGIGFTLPK